MACASNTNEFYETKSSSETNTSEQIVDNLYKNDIWHSPLSIPNQTFGIGSCNCNGNCNRNINQSNQLQYNYTNNLNQSPISINDYLATNPTLNQIIKDNSNKTLHFYCYNYHPCMYRLYLNIFFWLLCFSFCHWFVFVCHIRVRV